MSKPSHRPGREEIKEERCKKNSSKNSYARYNEIKAWHQHSTPRRPTPPAHMTALKQNVKVVWMPSPGRCAFSGRNYRNCSNA